jgi:hypothetical protein
MFEPLAVYQKCHLLSVESSITQVYTFARNHFFQARVKSGARFANEFWGQHFVPGSLLIEVFIALTLLFGFLQATPSTALQTAYSRTFKSGLDAGQTSFGQNSPARFSASQV